MEVGRYNLMSGDITQQRSCYLAVRSGLMILFKGRSALAIDKWHVGSSVHLDSASSVTTNTYQAYNTTSARRVI
jgi:hypothetical protein